MPKEILTRSQKSIEEYLNELDFSRVEPVKPGQLAMRGKIVTEGKEFDTVISIDNNVPASYPKFYSVNCDMVFFQPHIERPEHIPPIGILTGMCYKPEDEKIYYQNPKELIHHCLNDYERLCSDLSLGNFESKVELFEEFDSYWPNNGTIHKYMKGTLVDKKMVSLIILTPQCPSDAQKSSQLILTDCVAEIESYAKIARYKTSSVMCPYIDFAKTFGLPLPYTYEDLLKKIIKTGHLKFIKKLQDKLVSNFLIIGFDLPCGTKHYATVHIRNDTDIVLNDKKSIYQLFFNNKFKKVPFHGGQIKSISREWLMERGGDTKVSTLSSQGIKIIIVGCGSVGSNLAYKLCKNGLNDITLIDPEALKSSNIGRHFLGMQYVGNNKASAMAEVLQSQFVGMKVKAHAGKAQDSIDEIAKADLVITAIGSDEPAVEPYLAALVQQEKLPKMIACWLEADAIAGHAFVVDTNIPFSFEQMTNKMELIESEFASSLVKSENGCNSNYMPYSHLSADEHINRMARFILESILESKIARALSSIGNIEKFKKHMQYSANENSIIYWQDEDFNV